MITVASVDYCERCRCKTLHVPLPSGERACEYHLPGPELGPGRCRTGDWHSDTDEEPFQ